MGAVVALAAVLGVGLVGLEGSGQALAAEPGTLTVTGSASTSVEPDGASLDLNVSRVEATASLAQSRANSTMACVVSALTDQGLTTDNLRTVSISLFEEFDFTEIGRERIGFRFSNTIRVSVDSVEATAGVIDAAVSAGGDSVSLSNVRFLVSNRAEVETAVRLAAIDDAIEKATAMAERAGVQLGNVIAIEEIGFSSPRAVGGIAFAADAAATPIFGGTEEISASVRIVFAIS